MATLAVTGPRDLLARLPSQSVPLSIVASTAAENDDGTWSVTVYAGEEQVPALESLGYTVRVVTSDAELLARWQEIEVDEPGVS
jgi:hypothetical protein